MKVRGMERKSHGVDERTEGLRGKLRRRRIGGGDVSFSRRPPSHPSPSSTPPSPLGSQVARLGTDGPPSLLHAGPAAPSKHKAAVVGGRQPDVTQRKDGRGVFEGSGTGSPSTHHAQAEQSTAWQGQEGFFFLKTTG